MKHLHLLHTQQKMIGIANHTFCPRKPAPVSDSDQLPVLWKKVQKLCCSQLQNNPKKGIPTEVYPLSNVFYFIRFNRPCFPTCRYPVFFGILQSSWTNATMLCCSPLGYLCIGCTMASSNQLTFVGFQLHSVPSLSDSIRKTNESLQFTTSFPFVFLYFSHAFSLQFLQLSGSIRSLLPSLYCLCCI